MSEQIMSMRDYLKRGGAVCPVCNSVDLTFDDFPDNDGTSMSVRVSCNDCNSRWMEFYTLDGYDNLIVRGEGDYVNPEVE